MQGTEEQLEALEIKIEDAKAAYEDMRSLQRLYANKDFKRIIMKGYYVDEASRLVLAKAIPETQSKDIQKGINKSLDAIGYFRQYLISVKGIGDLAEKALIDDQETREEILAEAV